MTRTEALFRRFIEHYTPSMYGGYFCGDIGCIECRVSSECRWITGDYAENPDSKLAPSLTPDELLRTRQLFPEYFV